jgi:hypothetical protein
MLVPEHGLDDPRVSRTTSLVIVFALMIARG